ncbi:MAG TPA: hypothetical protein PLI98_17415 [Candidatus Hydrogenedentes bacterium]|nr:hypothetical protein [Candidatus Hydrogenedentota bacterium]
MGWLRDMGEWPPEEAVTLLNEQLSIETVGIPLTCPRRTVEEDGSVSLTDHEGTAATFWFAQAADGGIRLFFVLPLCAVPPGDRAAFYESLLQTAGAGSFFRFHIHGGVVHLSGSLHADEVTDGLLPRLTVGMFLYAKTALMTLSQRFGVGPWYGADPETAGRWDAYYPDAGCDARERIHRNLCVKMRRGDGHIRARAEAAGYVPPAGGDARDMGEKTPAEAPAPFGDGGLMEGLPGLEDALLEQLALLPGDLADTFPDLTVRRHNRHTLAVTLKGFTVFTGFVAGGLDEFFLYCHTPVCTLPESPSDAVYRVLLDAGCRYVPVQVGIVDNAVGLCGGLDWRLLTHGDGQRLLLRILNLAEELHEELTRRHGLTSLRGPVEEPPPRDAKARRRAK